MLWEHEPHASVYFVYFVFNILGFPVTLVRYAFHLAGYLHPIANAHLWNNCFKYTYCMEITLSHLRSLAAHFFFMVAI